MGTDISVLIVEDHEYLRYGLATYLETCDGLHVVGTAANGKEAVERCAQLHPDVVLMDIQMPQMDGIAATRLIREQHPETQIVILTNGIDDLQIDEALAAGARKFLFKSVSIERISEAIRAAYGDYHLSPE